MAESSTLDRVYLLRVCCVRVWVTGVCLCAVGRLRLSTTARDGRNSRTDLMLLMARVQ
jgi:hypothetical protein